MSLQTLFYIIFTSPLTKKLMFLYAFIYYEHC